jgi:membrane protease YdiL (CAAX protease family)
MFHLNPGQPTAITTILDEVVQLAGILGAVLICSRIEHRRILDYNLAGPRPTGHFLAGLGAGILALSALVGALYAGHWLHFGAVGLSGAQIFEYGGLWGVAFLLTGFCEEGSVRCYLQFTLARGINYWWAVGLIGAMSLSGLLFQMGEGIWGVYILAAAGVVPCFLLHRSKSDSARFWQAAWVTSTFFGFIHTGNNGETGIGIFSASAIGFVFCVSIRLTGSAWWAIGFHAAWDWAQTFLYGTADSGLAAKGHFFSTSPAGPEIWSGGSDGPEGSLLVIPIVLFTLVALVLVYRRNKCMESPSPAVPARLS